MAKTSATPLTNATAAVREEDLEELEKFKIELQDRADQARTDGRPFMMQQYVHLIAIVSTQTTKLRKRFERESLAEMRRANKLLKEQQKQEQEAKASA